MKRRCPSCGQPSMPDRRACWRCHKAAYRATHPVRDAFHRLRSHAKARRISVDLSFWEWELFCVQTGYHERTGNEGDNLTVDRFDAERAYEATNIRILPRTENSRKWWETDRPRQMARREA